MFGVLKRKRAKQSPTGEAAPRTVPGHKASGRKAAVVVAIAVLAVFLGALAGALCERGAQAVIAGRWDG